MLKPHAAWWHDFWAQSAVSIPDLPLQQYYQFARYLYGAGSRQGAPPIPLQGVWTADNGGLPPWKGDYHNDLNTQMTYIAYQGAGQLRLGTVLSRLPDETDTRVPAIRPGFLRHSRPVHARRDEPGRPTARRLGPIRALAHHDRLERPSVLSALALYRRRHLPPHPGLAVVRTSRPMPGRPAQARCRRPPRAAILLLAGNP